MGRAGIFDPAANAAAALRYVRERYARPWELHSGLSREYVRSPHEEEHPMSETTISAPANPYRDVAQRLDGLATFAGAPGSAPRRHDGDDGPGLTAGDLDRIVRMHHRDGYALAEREAAARIEELRGQLAQAFDEGYTAGRVERAQGLARDVFARLMGPHMKLIEARGAVKAGTKAGDAARAGFDEVEGELKDVQQFVAALFTPHDAAASSRAAAQAARDES